MSYNTRETALDHAIRFMQNRAPAAHEVTQAAEQLHSFLMQDEHAATLIDRARSEAVELPRDDAPMNLDARYSVGLLDRIADLLLEDQRLDDLTEFTYSWHAGYEEVIQHRRGSGSLHYGGVYHPNGGMCQGNPCEFCGHAYYDETMEDDE